MRGLFIIGLTLLFTTNVIADDLDLGMPDNPGAFDWEDCRCMWMHNLNGSTAGLACLCGVESELPFLIFTVFPGGLDALHFQLDQLANESNAERLKQRWGLHK